MIIRDELINLEKEGKPMPSVDRPQARKMKAKYTDRKRYFRETLRKFESPAGNLENYRKSASIRTTITRPHNLIEPVHLFLNKTWESTEEKVKWIAEETVRFAAACMNERTNGTIHFGVEQKANSEWLEGEIVGIDVDKDSCKRAMYQAITSHFYDDQIELGLKCIRPVEFIGVTNDDTCERQLVVVEVDIVPNSTLLQEEAVYVKFEDKMFFYRFVNDDPHPLVQTEEQIRQYMKFKKQLAQCRKERENIPKRVPIQEDLRQKFLNLFSGGYETLSEEMYPIIFLSPLECDTVHNFTENFQFVDDIKPCVIFDFNSSSDVNGMYHFVEVEKEQVVKVLTTENFDRNSVENKTDHERRNHLFDDLRTSALRPWVFCNGYDAMKKEPMDVLDWKRNRSEGLKEALRFYGEEVPNGRAMVIFLLLSKNYDVLLEAAEDVILKFQDQWMLFAPSEDIANNWMAELLRRKSIDKNTMQERCIIGLPWNHVNIMLQKLVSTNNRGSCEIATSKGAFCFLRDKVRNELYDLDVLSRRECDDTEITQDSEKLEKHRRESQEAFFRGNEVTWWNYWFGADHVLRRSQHSRLMEILADALKGNQNDDDCRIAVVSLMHQPGAGGTTSARQLLWDSREKYRCCVVKQISDQTCDQISLLRNYEDPSTPNPPIVLLDNCDEEDFQNLYASLENRARLTARRSETTPFSCFCVLLLCTRRTNLPTKVGQSVVLLKHELDPRELDWFNMKYESLEQKYQNENGVNPRLLISFNILKENFKHEYITRTVQQYVDSIEVNKEKDLLLYLAMMNSYDIDFQSLPISAFDSMMMNGQTKEGAISFGLVSPRRQSFGNRHWENNMSSSLQVLLNRSSRGGLGTNLHALSIISKLFAREIFKFLQKKLQMETSAAMLQFLNSDVFNNQNRSVDQVKRIVKDILKKREQLEDGKRESFSPLIVEIYKNEDPDQAAKVLLKGFDMTQDPMIAQQIARFYMSFKNWEEATKYAKMASQMKQNNSYLWDTYGLVYKNRLQEKYECCLQQGTKLSFSDTREVIQLAKTGIDIFHKEQSVSEQEKHASTNDAGYYNEVHLVILLLDLLKVSSSITGLHNILVDKELQYQKVASPELDKESFDNLRTLRFYTDAAMRKLEDKTTQLKDSAMKNAHLSKSGFAYRTLPRLRENVDSYFGEDTDEVPETLSEKDQADFRRRRIRKLGGRSLANILELRREPEGGCKLEAIFRHLQSILNSENVTAFDIKSFISVAIVMHITKVRSDPYPYQKLVELSKRLYNMQNTSADELPYLEVFLYLLMLHWPTENRQHLQLYPVGKLPDAMQKWKTAFQRNHPRQMDGNPYRLKRETTYFFLGNGKEYDEIIYYEELHGSHTGRYYKGDTVWSQPQNINRLKRLEGILINNGTEVSVHIETAGGNKTQIVIPTGMHIGQRNLWQKRIYFYLGFTWLGPKAFDVSQNDRRLNDQEARYFSQAKNVRSKPVPLQPEPDVAKQILGIHDSLKKIEQLKKLKGRSMREENLIKREPELRSQLTVLIRSRQELFKH